jgi:hypothetical protein
VLENSLKVAVLIEFSCRYLKKQAPSGMNYGRGLLAGY